MKIIKDSATPIYIQVADYLRNNIYSEKWAKNEQISSEKQIMDELSISRGTVKKAVDLLVQEGLLEQIQGKGTFVTGDNLTYPLGEGLLSFAEQLESQNVVYATKLLEMNIQTANKEVALRLNLNIGDEYLYLKRLRSVQNEKVMLIENRINHRLVPNIMDEDFNKESLFKIIEKNSEKDIIYSESRYAARVVGEERGNILEVSPISPVLHLEQVVYLSGKIPVEFGNVWLIANKYFLGTVFKRKEK